MAIEQQSVQGRYDLRQTTYICSRCNVPIEIESRSYYEFSSADDPAFWCFACNDLPHAKSVGISAETLPTSLQLPKGFVLSIVLKAQIWDREDANLLFRPYSKRSFLAQYLAWAKNKGCQSICTLSSAVTVGPKFDMSTQQFSGDVECDIADQCDEHHCQFLAEQILKPAESIDCATIRVLCDKDSEFGLCQTGDEAMLLQHFLLLTGGYQFPMLIPQASILHGRRRPDFVCFVPITKFQYHKIAVLVDRPGKPPSVIATENAEYEQQGFIVKRMLIDSQTSYFKLARELVLWLESV